MCPFCTNQTLHILQTASGPVEQCPACSGLLVPWDMLARFSGDPSFLSTLVEAQSKLLPTGRICPHCLGRLAQGKITGKQGIVTVCVTCKLLWTDLYDLEQLDPIIARSLQAQMENPSVVPTPNPAPFRPGEPSPFPTLLTQEPLLDSGFAPMSSKQVDVEKQYKELEKTLREEWDKREEQRELLHSEILKKAQGEHTQHLEALQKSIAELEKKRLDQETHLKELDKAFQDKLNAAQAEYARHLEALVSHIDGLEKRRQGQDSDVAELKKRLETMEKQPKPVVYTPTPPAPIVETPKPIPEIPKEPVKIPPPIVEKPPSLIAGLLSPTKPEKSGFLGTLRSAWNPTPKPSKPKPTPKIEPAKPEPTKVSTKPKKEINWADLMAGWLPRVLPVLTYLIMGAMEDDWGRAILWAFAAWSIGSIVRLWRMYPRGPFKETTVNDLANLPGATAWKGVGVSLKGQVELDAPRSKRLHFKDATGMVLLNVLGRLELLPQVFGLVTLGQYPTGEFALKGWYRRSTAPCIEVAEARSDKTLRKSLVKVLRWTTAILVLFFSILLLFVIE